MQRGEGQNWPRVKGLSSGNGERHLGRLSVTSHPHSVSSTLLLLKTTNPISSIHPRIWTEPHGEGHYRPGPAIALTSPGALPCLPEHRGATWLWPSFSLSTALPQVKGTSPQAPVTLTHLRHTSSGPWGSNEHPAQRKRELLPPLGWERPALVNRQLGLKQ